MSGRLLLALSLLACCCLPGSGALPNVRQCLGNAGRFVLRRGPVKKVEIVQNEAPLPPLRRTIKQNVVELVKNGVASGMASASVKSVLHPFDVVKTMQQHSSEDLDIIQAARKIIARDGGRGLYRGLDVTLLGSVPSIAVYFAVYQYMKRMLTALFGPGYLQIAVAVSAAAANCLAALVRVPTEMVKQRVQAGIYPSATAAFKDMWAKGGAQQFLCSRSVMAQMARDVPYAVCLLLTYEALQNVQVKIRTPPESEGEEAEGGQKG
eukprot:CAMPEP_0180151150 /NCGR_PEP_ID=MMETSP0986-20121125/21941_1 /TAXON_ID=697907 /ORGANISM="non described non described, Strain CCMP2293" /LENGTH=264 /DNA_ID=CAMNT_0022098357 /DNA_START=8 /DNA_END=798 /DNA_ORIENTATION=+